MTEQDPLGHHPDDFDSIHRELRSRIRSFCTERGVDVDDIHDMDDSTLDLLLETITDGLDADSLDVVAALYSEDDEGGAFDSEVLIQPPGSGAGGILRSTAELEPQGDRVLAAMHQAIDRLRDENQTLVVSRDGEIIELTPDHPDYWALETSQSRDQ